MKRRLWIPALLAAVALTAVLAVLAGRTPASSASYTTSSESSVAASADTTAAWLRVYSQGTDPQDRTGYALRRGLNGVPGQPAAIGQDDGLAVDLGDFPDRNATFTFSRVFSVRTPDEFPDPSVTQITVTVSTLPDPATGDTMLQQPTLTVFGQTSGGVQTIALGPGADYQFNVNVRTRKKFVLGQTYFPRVRLSLTVAGLAGYYGYEFPLQVRDAGGS